MIIKHVILPAEPELIGDIYFSVFRVPISATPDLAVSYVL
jgi:hypothetical protein